MIREIGGWLRETTLKKVGVTASRLRETSPLDVDILETETAYIAVFDAPGAAAEELQVRYKGGSVLVRIDRNRKHFPGFKMVFPGRALSMSGVADLPDDAFVDPEKATAKLRENGSLEIEIPKQSRS